MADWAYQPMEPTAPIRVDGPLVLRVQLADKSWILNEKHPGIQLGFEQTFRDSFSDFKTKWEFYKSQGEITPFTFLPYSPTEDTPATDELTVRFMGPPFDVQMLSGDLVESRWRFVED